MMTFRLLLSVVLVSGLIACASAHHSVEDGDYGGMDKTAIRETVRSHAKEILACYDAQLESKPELEGRLIMQWDIGEKGKTANVRVVQPFEPAVDDCVALKIESWTFPTEPSEKGKVGRIVFPFVFSSKEAGEKK
ncbi:MAG: AgmX/PglI C-terminal domain-containing protein [Bdellovibrionales bacterium]|nr:AgmX/PglI C-terminal domain-containing protein [Bdellovibrionales bacterium]